MAAPNISALTSITGRTDGAAITTETTTFYIIKTLVVPADATIDVLSKPIYLEEGDKIQALAGVASDAQIIVSYEIIDDA